jgi:hypothetical protein
MSAPFAGHVVRRAFFDHPPLYCNPLPPDICLYQPTRIPQPIGFYKKTIALLDECLAHWQQVLLLSKLAATILGTKGPFYDSRFTRK